MDHMHGGFQMPMTAPPLMNQPPQIFGGYAEHGMPLHQMPPDLSVAQMFGDHGLLDDSQEAKRRRIARVSGLVTCQPSLKEYSVADALVSTGLRYVQEEKD